MVKNRDYLDIKEVLRNEKVPRDKTLILLKLKEIFHIESEAINVETIKGKTTYLIRYEDLLVGIMVDENEHKFILNPHFDVVNIEDEIVESY